jgi:hypothetical protein
VSIVQSGFSVNFPHMLDEQARHLAYLLRERATGAARASRPASRRRGRRGGPAATWPAWSWRRTQLQGPACTPKAVLRNTQFGHISSRAPGVLVATLQRGTTVRWSLHSGDYFDFPSNIIRDGATSTRRARLVGTAWPSPTKPWPSPSPGA